MFTPTADKLIPDLTPREELVVLARALWREGYNDHLAGHITVNQGDGTLLCNPWLLTWAELRPSQVLRIDLEGRVVEGDWPVPLGIPLHLELHKMRHDVKWAMHNHPLFGTVWADIAELPPILDQSSALGGGTLALVDEYEGPVNDAGSARRAVEQMGDASMALLAGHGVFVLGGSARAVHQRAVALEQRCQHAWYARAFGGSAVSRVPQTFIDLVSRGNGEGFIGFWEAAVRNELAADPDLLQP
jgi:L-ribulose-5-phosphate 4-epimerase